MEKVESNITQFTEAASERFRKAFAIYKRRLKDNPDLNLRAFCHEVHVDYAGMSSWCNHHGVGLLKLRREAQTGMLTGEPMTFIQVQPSCTSPSSGSLYLRGIIFGLESSTRYFMCQHPVSMRKGIDSLFNLVVSESPMSPMTGDVFVFFSKNRQSVKLLRWDTDGFLLYQKRLERGSFEMPRKNADTGYYELSWETFSFIMSGVSLDSVCFRKRYRTRFMSI